MSRESIATPLLAGLILLCVASTSNANLIAYNTGGANHARMMVMSDTGANPTEIYDYGTSSWTSHLTISPSGPGLTTWVAFEVSGDLYKVRTDGTELIRMLCGEGTDIDSDLYALMGQPQWSPQGTEILVQTTSGLALVPADSEARSDCSSDLEPIYFSDALIDPPVEWTLGGMATWNDDSSKIAFFEQPPGETYTPPYNRLVVLERLPDGSWAVDEEQTIYPTPGLPDSTLLEIDWQRGGDLVAFVGRGESRGRPKFWLMWVNLTTKASGYFLTGGARIEGRSPSWSPDGSQLIFEDKRDNLVKWTHVPSTFPDGPIETIGSGTSPDWQRDLVVVECGDGVCAGAENQCSCEADCGEAPLTETSCTDLIDNDCFGDIDCDDPDCADDPVCVDPYCGDNFCDLDENACSCPGDCGTSPSSEVGLCTDEIDNDCDGLFDCDDALDCADDASCIGGLPGDPCTSGADCLSGLCHPKKRVCK